VVDRRKQIEAQRYYSTNFLNIELWSYPVAEQLYTRVVWIFIQWQKAMAMLSAITGRSPEPRGISVRFPCTLHQPRLDGALLMRPAPGTQEPAFCLSIRLIGICNVFGCSSAVASPCVEKSLHSCRDKQSPLAWLEGKQQRRIRQQGRVC
jgi:hypothetical protein